jgi:hypothetical protein
VLTSISASFLHCIMGMKTQPKIAVGGLLLASVFSSCSSAEYRYEPTEHQASQNGLGKDEALYQEPTNQPDGKVKIVSMGVVDIRSKKDSNTFPAIHLRMAVTNDSRDDQWTLNSLDQFVSFPNAGEAKAIPMNSDSGTLVAVQPGGLKTLDFYFPLPDNERSIGNIPQFDFHWRLQAGASPVQETTSFDRVQVEERYASAYPYGYGYYDPWFYPGPYYGWGPGWRGGGTIVVRPR